MKRYRKTSLVAALALIALLLAWGGPQAAKYWDGYFTNVLVKGHLLVKKQAEFESGATLVGAAHIAQARITPDVVMVTTPSQLSTWSGAASGQSYFQSGVTGVLILVDPHALVSYGCAPGSTTGFVNFSGVSVVLPSGVGNDGGLVGVGMMVSGNTGWDSLKTGNTIVSVWPHAGTGATTYNSNATKPQTLMTVYGTNGTVGTYTMGAGVSYWEINMPGEVAWFRLEASNQVSATPVIRNVLN